MRVNILSFGTSHSTCDVYHCLSARELRSHRVPCQRHGALTYQDAIRARDMETLRPTALAVGL